MKSVRKYKTLIGLLAIVYVVIVMFSFASCGAKAGPQGGPDGPMGPQGPMPYAVAAVYSGNATVYYSFPASLQGEQNVEIRPKVDGFIENIFVDEGAVVHKGQRLFQLRNPQYEAAVRTAMANVKIAQADVQTAQNDVDKVRPLVEKNIISAYELKSKELTLQAKNASLASANADLLNANVNVGYTYLTSPSDGIIGTIPYKVGSLVSSNSTNPLTTVYNTRKVYAYFSLNEKQLLGFLRAVKGENLQDKLATMGDVSLVLADGSAYPVKGRLVTASGLISTETGSASFRANFDNTSGLIRSGNSALIKIPVNIDSAVLVPQNATYDMQGKKFVYTLVDNDSAVNTEIQVSENTIGKFYIVESGLKPGDQLIVEGVGNMKPGMLIKPIPVNVDSLYTGIRAVGNKGLTK